MGRRANGKGTLFKRKDGRWSAQVYVTLSNGTTKRVCITSRSRDVVSEKLREALEQKRRHIPYVEKEWTISEYLDYWMKDVQANRIRETTIASYDVLIEKHIKPALGGHLLKGLCVQDVRCAMDELHKQGRSGRTRRECLRVLSACFNCAMREELIFRNVAQLVEKPKYVTKPTVIWTADQAAHFLESIKNHPQYVAFLLFLTYGMRRGEVLGLRYCDVDLENGLIYVRQQIDRINGKLKARDLKTVNSRRTLPAMESVRKAIVEHAAKNSATIPSFNPHIEESTEGTIIVSRAGTPLEPRRLGRCFEKMIENTGLPRITLHAMRHTAATNLKDLGVPVKDAQLILGHSDIATTLNIYQHGTFETHRTAIAAVEERLLQKGSVMTIGV